MKLKYSRKKDPSDKKEQKKKGFRKVSVLVAAVMGAAGCVFDMAGLGLSENTNSNHNDAGVIDVIDVNVNNNNNSNSNHNDGSIDVPNHPDAAIDASQNDSSVVDAGEDSSVVDAGEDSSVVDASVDSGLVCVASLCDQPFNDSNSHNVNMGDVMEVGNFRIRYTQLTQELSPTHALVDIECKCTTTGGDIVLRPAVELIETQEQIEIFVDHPTAGQSWRIRMTTGTGNQSYLPLTSIVEQI